MRILILGAFENELSSLTLKFQDLKETIISKRRCKVTKLGSHEIIFSLSGIGTTSAASTTTALCEALDPDFIILCGVAGGLDTNQKIGDLILANKIIDCELIQLDRLLSGTPYEPCLTDPHTLKPITSEYIVHPLLLKIGSLIQVERIKTGIIATSNIFPAPKSLFAEIKKFGCSAIEMESVGVFKAAGYYDTPVMTIRAISNLLNSSGMDSGTPSEAIDICSERIALFLTMFLTHTPLLEPTVKLKQQQIMTDIVTKYELIQHPEGGWYRQTFRSEDLISAEGDALARYGGESRVAGTSIIYLLTEDDFSAWHTVQSDETWSFHDGDPLLLRVIDPSNGELKQILLGLTNGVLQLTIKAGHIFSAETLGRFSLTGCMVTPGFDFKDFKLITQREFLARCPQHAMFARLTREKPVVSSREDALETTPLRTKFFDQGKPSIVINSSKTTTAPRSLTLDHL